MVIDRDRYLDDTRRFRLTASLTTRTGVMHSLLTNVPEEDRQAIGDVLVRALDEIEKRLRPHVGHAVRP